MCCSKAKILSRKQADDDFPPTLPASFDHENWVTQQPPVTSADKWPEGSVQSAYGEQSAVSTDAGRLSEPH
jgi:hypothetical protein